MTLESKSQKNCSISLVRITAMFIVVFLHLLQSNGYSTASFPWFCGVPLFLIVSGYLYGKKNIKNWKDWYVNKFYKIILPYYFLLILNTIIAIVNGRNVGINQIIKGMLLLPSFKVNDFGMAHIWYLQYAIITYLMIPMLQRIFKIGGGIYRLLAKLFGVLIGAVIVTELVSQVPFIGNYSAVQVNIFVGAYFLSRYRNSDDRRNSMTFMIVGIVLTILIEIAIVINPIEMIDRNLALYREGSISYILFGSIMYVCTYINWKDVPNILLKTLNLIDMNSYYVYLVHYWFTAMSWFNVFENGVSIISVCLYFVGITTVTVLFRLLLNKVNGWCR